VQSVPEIHSLKIDPEDLEGLLLDIERAFEVRFVQKDVEDLHTVGDLYDLLQVKMGTTARRRERCLSAVCFYRLKRAVADISGAKIGPQTAITDVFEAKALKPAMTDLAEKTGLRLPAVRLSSDQVLLFLLGVSSCAAAFYFGLTTMAGITALLIALGFVCVLRFAKFPRSMAEHSFGDLARATVFLNYGRLARETGVRHSADLWDALDSMLRSCAAFEGTIERDFRLT
jgi:hypothetical protein